MNPKLVTLEDGQQLALVPTADGLLRVQATPEQMRVLGRLLAPQLPAQHPATPLNTPETPETPPTMPQPSRWQELWQWLLGDVL